VSWRAAPRGLKEAVRRTVPNTVDGIAAEVIGGDTKPSCRLTLSLQSPPCVGSPLVAGAGWSSRWSSRRPREGREPRAVRTAGSRGQAHAAWCAAPARVAAAVAPAAGVLPAAPDSAAPVPWQPPRRPAPRARSRRACYTPAHPPPQGISHTPSAELLLRRALVGTRNSYTKSLPAEPLPKSLSLSPS
jgi:hypothetical protein